MFLISNHKINQNVQISILQYIDILYYIALTFQEIIYSIVISFFLFPPPFLTSHFSKNVLPYFVYYLSTIGDQ